MPDGRPGADTLAPEQQSLEQNTPASGSFGEKAELNRLKSSLPGDAGSGPQGPGPSAYPGVASVPQAPGRPAQGPAGIPSAVLAPTQSTAPVTSPLRREPVNPVAAQANDQQRRLALYDTLSQHPHVSQETREFFRMIRDRLAGG